MENSPVESLNLLYPTTTGEEPILFKDKKGQEIRGRLHDADTIITEANGNIRFGGGIDAAETPKITSVGGFSAGSRLGLAQKEAVNLLIKEGGYTNIPSASDKLSYGRSVADLQQPSGSKLSSALIANDIIPANAWTTPEDIEARSITRFHNAVRNSSVVRPIDKARSIVEDALRGTGSISAMQANTIEEYQNYVGATGHKGLGQQEEMIKALETRIQSPKINDKQREAAKAKLEILRSNYQSNLNAPRNIYISSLEGMNTTPSYGSMGEMGRAWDMGMVAVKDSAANFLDYAGDVINSPAITEYSKGLLNKNEREHRKIDLKVGDKDVTGGTLTTLDDAIADPMRTFQFIGNSIMQYGPQMGVMVAGSVAGGVLAGPFGATIIPMAMAVADVYGEQADDEKNPLVASAAGIAIGLVDRFGFSRGAIKAKDLLTVAGRDKVAQYIASNHISKSITLPEAKILLNSGISDLGKDYARLITASATNQLAAKKGLLDVLFSISKAAGKESATELLQEVMQYTAITETSSQDFNWEVLYKRAREAAVVGGILGGAMHTPSSMYEKSLFNQELNNISGVETRQRTDVSLMEREEILRNRGKLNDVQLSQQLRGSVEPLGKDKYGKDLPLSSFILQGDKASLWEDTKSILSNGGAFSQARDNAVAHLTKFIGGREIAGLLDAKSVRGVYSGLSAFKRIHMIANSVTAALPSRADKRILFGTDNNKDIGTALMDSLNNNSNHAGAKQFRTILDSIGNELADHLDELGVNTGWSSAEVRSPDFFLKNQIFDPLLVRTHEDELIKLLSAQWKSNGSVGSAPNTSYFKDLVARIKDNMSHREIGELNQLGVLNNPAFNKFKSKDVENNVARLTEAIARGSVRNSIFGANGEVLAKGIAKMLAANEITAGEASKLAISLEQQMQSFDGRLNRPESDLIRGVNENLTFASMMVYMDTSLFANLSEIVFGAIGLSPKNMVKYFGLTAKEFAKDLTTKFTQLGSMITRGGIKAQDEQDTSEAMQLLQQTGHHGKMNDIAFNVGANISTQSKRNMSKVMFKVNMVESATNAARAARASLAADEINHLVSIIAEVDTDNDMTRWARDRLAYYRMDPDELVDIYKSIGGLTEETIGALSPADPLFERIRVSLRDGIINFIDEFSSRPEPGSTAKILDDQRFVLFTQFKKFTWHFSSNVMPQLWNMYMKRGDVKYTYSTFSALMMAFAIAYAGMYLKDSLRGDESEKDDEKKLAKRLRQSFDYTIGQAHSDVFTSTARLVTDIGSTARGVVSNPLSTNPFNPLINQSPALNMAVNTGKDLYGIASKEDDSKEKTNLIKRVPVFGEIPGVRHFFEKENKQ